MVLKGMASVHNTELEQRMAKIEKELDNFIAHFNGAIERTIKRVDALENASASNIRGKSEH